MKAQAEITITINLDCPRCLGSFQANCTDIGYTPLEVLKAVVNEYHLQGTISCPCKNKQSNCMYPITIENIELQ